jgi:dolichol-phosphate mannosyltransferase
MKYSIIVPCYNEIDNVPKLRNELLPVIEALVEDGRAENSEDCSAEVIFVDDGSRDGTFPVIPESLADYDKPGITFKYEKHPTNLGLGAAMRTGFAAAVGDILITVDSDGTYQFSEIPNLLSYLTPDIHIVTASPYHPEGNVVGVPAYRLILSRGSSLIYRILLDWHIYTYTCLFRAYRSEVIRDIKFEANGFLAGTELLVKAMLKGYRVAEFPAVLYKRMYGVSKAKIANTILAHLKFQWRVLVYRLQFWRSTSGKQAGGQAWD